MVTVRVKKELIQELRVKKGLSREELARQAGITRQFMTEIEKGVKSPSLRTLAKIAAALGINTTDLFEEERD